MQLFFEPAQVVTQRRTVNLASFFSYLLAALKLRGVSELATGPAFARAITRLYMEAQESFAALGIALDFRVLLDPLQLGCPTAMHALAISAEAGLIRPINQSTWQIAIRCQQASRLLRQAAPSGAYRPLADHFAAYLTVPQRTICIREVLLATFWEARSMIPVDCSEEVELPAEIDWRLRAILSRIHYECLVYNLALAREAGETGTATPTGLLGIIVALRQDKRPLYEVYGLDLHPTARPAIRPELALMYWRLARAYLAV